MGTKSGRGSAADAAAPHLAVLDPRCAAVRRWDVVILLALA